MKVTTQLTSRGPSRSPDTNQQAKADMMVVWIKPTRWHQRAWSTLCKHPCHWCKLRKTLIMGLLNVAGHILKASITWLTTERPQQTSGYLLNVFGRQARRPYVSSSQNKQESFEGQPCTKILEKSKNWARFQKKFHNERHERQQKMPELNFFFFFNVQVSHAPNNRHTIFLRLNTVGVDE